MERELIMEGKFTDGKEIYQQEGFYYKDNVLLNGQ